MTIEPYKNSYDYLGIARGGIYANQGKAKIDIYDKRLPSYYGDLKEGGIVVDKRTCDEVDLINGVVKGPMKDMTLPSQTRSVMFGGTEPCTDPNTCGGFDLVSFDLYLMYWRQRHAKIGKRVGNTIVWENGDIDPILAEGLRFSQW